MTQRRATVFRALSDIMARLRDPKQRVAVICSDDRAQLYYFQQFCREFEEEIKGRHDSASMTARLLHGSRELNSVVTFFNVHSYRLPEGQQWSHVLLMLNERDLGLLRTIETAQLGLRLGDASLVEVEAR